MQLNPLGRLLRELQGQTKSRLDRCYLRNLQSGRGSGRVHCGDSRNEINVYKSVEDPVIYLDWIQNRLVLDPMQSYASLGRYLAKLGRS